ncbi:hypothetical protein BDW22DRAFT_1326075 [Trametopsis cervina]|nr:hypothetical protein BDW22DRAFT_1326075 [Trametopsis cervina]
MDYWPTGYGEGSGHYRPRSQGKGKERAGSQRREHPLVEPGSVAAANLVRRGKLLDWNFLNQNVTGRRLRAKGTPAKIFPATFPKPAHTSPLSILHEAEQGAQFLRTHYPDVDVASDLIRQELKQNARHASERAEFDPFSGNKLAVITDGRTRRKSAYLAFPAGPTGRDLNISCLSYSKEHRVLFKPSATAVKVFDTPIDQIAREFFPGHTLSNTPSSGTYLAIRIAGSTHVTKVQCGEHTSIQTVATWSRSDTGQRHIMDMVFPDLSTARHGSILVVNDCGQVYRCSADSHRPTELIHTSSADTSNFWRIAATPHAETLLLLSNSSLRLLDFRSRDGGLQILSEEHGHLCSLRSPTPEHMFSVASTSELTWIDERFPQKPLISYKHGRRSDRMLHVDIASFTDGPITFLSSYKDNLVTVYDVAQDKSGVVHMNTPVYTLPPLPLLGVRAIGHAFIRHPADMDANSVSFLRLSDRGSIHRLDLSLDDQDEPLRETHVWSDEVQQLDERELSRAEDGPLSERAFSEVDLEIAYRGMFTLQDGMQSDGEAVYDTLAAMQSFWSGLDEPVDNILTASDVAFRAGTEPGDPSRADFLTESKINSTRGYRALIQGRIPLGSVAKTAAWHHNIGSTLRTFIPELSESPQDVFVTLESRNLQMDDFRTGPSIRRETEAREQVTLDIALSTDIYSPHSIKLTDSVQYPGKAMSIGVPEPPRLHFGFLRPEFDREREHYTDNKADTEAKNDHPLGVRLLLKDWELGTDPSLYTYHDPYDSTSTIMPRPARPARPPPPIYPEMSQSQRAPPVIATIFPAFSRNMPHIGSQPSANGAVEDESQSQVPLMPSTQVLSGPYGGRPLVKKKPVKKRLGSLCHDAVVLQAVCTMRYFAPARIIDHAWYACTPWLVRKPEVHITSAKRAPFNILFDSAARHEYLRRNKPVVCAISASYVSTFAGYPLDSLKSRLQTTRTKISIPRLALQVYREEGVIGFYRGLWIPLITISFVRAASFTIYTSTKEYCRDHNLFTRNNIIDAAATGGLGGALSGSLISVGSTPFELVKVRRQLEYSIAESKGVRIVKPPGTSQAVREIYKRNGLRGLYTGFHLHCLRDTLGTSLYFFEYDGLRHIMGRLPTGEQGPPPVWMPIHSSLIPFLCGSLAGVTSWALIYPLDVVKTKVQQRALAGTPPRSISETLYRLIRGPDPSTPRSVPQGLARIYRGLGVSALRSVTTHGLLWTLFDITAAYIDNLPHD